MAGVGEALAARKGKAGVKRADFCPEIEGGASSGCLEGAKGPRRRMVLIGTEGMNNERAGH